MKQLKFTIYLYFHVNLHQGACREHFTIKFSLTKVSSITANSNIVFTRYT